MLKGLKTIMDNACNDMSGKEFHNGNSVATHDGSHFQLFHYDFKFLCVNFNRQVIYIDISGNANSRSTISQLNNALEYIINKLQHNTHEFGVEIRIDQNSNIPYSTYSYLKQFKSIEIDEIPC